MEQQPEDVLLNNPSLEGVVKVAKSWTEIATPDQPDRDWMPMLWIIPKPGQQDPLMVAMPAVMENTDSKDEFAYRTLPLLLRKGRAQVAAFISTAWMNKPDLSPDRATELREKFPSMDDWPDDARQEVVLLWAYDNKVKQGVWECARILRNPLGQPPSLGPWQPVIPPDDESLAKGEGRLHNMLGRSFALAEAATKAINKMFNRHDWEDGTVREDSWNDIEKLLGGRHRLEILKRSGEMP